MSSSLMPDSVCWNQDQQLIWTMVVTNAVTFLSYFSICATLFYLARRTRKAIAHDWGYFLIGFGLFIIACGTTHLMEVITTWIPVFWVAAGTNVVTAILSAYVAIQFFRRASTLGLGINDYAARLSNAENEKAQIEESLVSARKLEEWNRMSAVVTHEINNPLAAIQNLLFLMQLSSELTPETAAMVQQASDEVRRIETLTRSTLGFFRQSLTPEKVDLRNSAESVHVLLEPLRRQRGLELEIVASGDCTVEAYAVETRQVLLNLTRNACEATTQKGGKVTITLEGRPDDVQVVVADEGSGISPSVLSNLFQFGASTKGDRGNGMGLWLVKQLVSRHGGTVSVESTQGQGSRFTVLWPRRLPATPEIQGSVAAGAAR